MSIITDYEYDSGQVVSVTEGPDDGYLMAFGVPDGDNIAIYSGELDADAVYVTGTATTAARIAYTITSDVPAILPDGIDAATLTLPDPCYIRVDQADVATEVIGGSYVATSNTEGYVDIELIGQYYDPDGPYSVEVKTVATAKAQSIDLIKLVYTYEIRGGFDYDGNRYESDLETIEVLTASEIIGGGRDWYTIDNTAITLSTTDFSALYTAWQTLAYDLYVEQHERYDTLDAMTTLAQVHAFNQTLGYPILSINVNATSAVTASINVV